MNILITAGGTREYIDPVRFISNASTGKMGYALARAAIKAGHNVTLITAPTALKRPAATKIIEIETSAEMFKAVKEHFTKTDCLIMSAAVSDYKPEKTSKTKIKKSDAELTIKLKPTQDILKWAGRNKSTGQFIAGYALEDKSLKENAEAKLKSKNLDMIIANAPTAIAAEKSTIYIKTPKADWLELKDMKKEKTAARIIRLIDSYCG
ncbi:MAG: phosphopantothenoylcysteine decarboxylase [Phycisphaerae bacterium]|nr:phosphopantothenoylcysteine decarboxylase [Phycisphaerae bacterium]